MTTIKEQNSGISTRVWGLIAALLASPLFLVLALNGDPARGRAAGISAALIILLVRSRWELRRRTWFWVTVGLIIGVHASVVSLVSWEQKSYPGFALWPIGIADFCVMFGIIKLVESAVSKSERTD